MSIIAIEIDTPTNGDIFFPPVSKRIRGRIECRRDNNMGSIGNTYPDGIPGQRLEYDTSTRELFIVEGIHDDDTIKERLVKRWRLPKARQPAGKHDLATIVHHMRRHVELGNAKLVNGSQFPTKIDGEPRKDFFAPAKSASKKLLDLFAKFVNVQVAALPPEQRKALES